MYRMLLLFFSVLDAIYRSFEHTKMHLMVEHLLRCIRTCACVKLKIGVKYQTMSEKCISAIDVTTSQSKLRQ